MLITCPHVTCRELDSGRVSKTKALKKHDAMNKLLGLVITAKHRTPVRTPLIALSTAALSFSGFRPKNACVRAKAITACSITPLTLSLGTRSRNRPASSTL